MSMLFLFHLKTNQTFFQRTLFRPLLGSLVGFYCVCICWQGSLHFAFALCSFFFVLFCSFHQSSVLIRASIHVEYSPFISFNVVTTLGQQLGPAPAHLHWHSSSLHGANATWITCAVAQRLSLHYLRSISRAAHWGPRWRLLYMHCTCRLKATLNRVTMNICCGFTVKNKNVFCLKLNSCLFC